MPSSTLFHQIWNQVESLISVKHLYYRFYIFHNLFNNSYRRNLELEADGT